MSDFAPHAPPQPCPGFTLIEVLIALAIVSVALAAFVRMTSLATANIEHIGQQKLALLCAENALAELQAGTLPPPGIQTIGCTQGDRTLSGRVTIDPAGQGGLRAIVVEVYDSDRRLASLKTRLPENSR